MQALKASDQFSLYCVERKINQLGETRATKLGSETVLGNELYEEFLILYISNRE
jgi:hypothetical protein